MNSPSEPWLHAHDGASALGYLIAAIVAAPHSELVQQDQWRAARSFGEPNAREGRACVETKFHPLAVSKEIQCSPASVDGASHRQVASAEGPALGMFLCVAALTQSTNGLCSHEPVSVPPIASQS